MNFRTTLNEHLDCIGRLEKLAPQIEAAGERLAAAVGARQTIIACGNGGSAADAQHFAAELIGRFEKERRAWPAIALTTDSSVLTAIGNDYGFDNIFSRQVQGLGRPGDMLVGISTSGNSENVLHAVAAARQQGMGTIGLLGNGGGRLKHEVDHAVTIDGQRTARIQEAHILVLHFWARMIEQRLAGDPRRSSGREGLAGKSPS